MDTNFSRKRSPWRRTKIVATLGPATESTAAIDRLIGLGVNCFRLNFSHGEHAWHEQLIGRVRESAERLGVPVAILQDISGPKIRVNPMMPMLLQHDQELMIFRDGVPPGVAGISINYPQVLDAIKVGDQIFFADGSIRTEAVRVGTEGVAVRVLQGGPLSSRKGVNLPVRGLDLSALTPKDRDDLLFGVRHGVDLVAVSFVRSAEDLLQARRVIVEAGGDTPIYAKIEKEEALDNLDEIIKVADGILVARGDLGVEIGLHRVPVVQKEILRRVGHKGLPVIVATQMLTSMVNSPYPTRAEVSDVANAVLDGADAVMLSEETTVGNYPGEAVAMLDLTIRETECCYPWYREFHEVGGPRRAFAAAAVTLQRTTGAIGIVSFTESGLIAMMVARQRPRTRMLAATSNPRTLRRLALVWGVEPVWMPVSYVNSDEAVYHFFREHAELLRITADRFYIATIGRNSDRSGSTNLMLLVDEPCLAQLAETHG